MFHSLLVFWLIVADSFLVTLISASLWELFDISMNTLQPNCGDTQTVLITHQESPSDLSGPTIDDSMPSGKENKQKKSRFLCH